MKRKRVPNTNSFVRRALGKRPVQSLTVYPRESRAGMDNSEQDSFASVAPLIPKHCGMQMRFCRERREAEESTEYESIVRRAWGRCPASL